MRFLLVTLMAATWFATDVDSKRILEFQIINSLPEELFVGFGGYEWMDEQHVDKQQLDSNGFQLEATFHDCITNDSKWNEELCPIQIGTEEQAKLFNTIIYQMVSFIPIRVDKLGLGCRSDAGTEFDLEAQKLLQSPIQASNKLVDFGKVLFSNGHWFVSDILRSLEISFLNYAYEWNRVIDETAGTKMKGRPFQDKLKCFLQKWEKLQEDTKNYLHACHLVHMIRVLGAFTGGKEFPREAIIDDGYKLLNDAFFGVQITKAIFANMKKIRKNQSNYKQNFTILKLYLERSGSGTKIDKVWDTTIQVQELRKELKNVVNVTLAFASDTENQHDGVFEKLMLYVGPAQEKVRVLKQMIIRAGTVCSNVCENSLKLLVDARFVIKISKSDPSEYVYRTVPYADGLTIKNLEPCQYEALDESIKQIVEYQCCPISLFPLLYVDQFFKNYTFYFSTDLKHFFTTQKLIQSSQSPKLLEDFREFITEKQQQYEKTSRQR